MSDELAASLEDTQTTPEEGDSPEVEETPAETPAEDSGYEKRYNDLRSQYDRIHPKYNQYEQVIQGLSNPETAPEILKAFGYDIEDEDGPEPDDLDPDERWEQRFDQIENYLQSEAEAKAEREAIELEQQYFVQEFGRLEKEHGELNDEERDTIAAIAYQLADEDGIPDVSAAFERLTGLVDSRHKKYLSSKKSPRVEPGSAGTEKIDMNDEDAVNQYMADLIEAGRDA